MANGGIISVWYGRLHWRFCSDTIMDEQVYGALIVGMYIGEVD
jgi:hypothetical protein